MRPASVVQLLQTPTVSCLNVACRASCVLYGSTSSAMKSTQAQQRSMFLSNVSKLIRYVACIGHSLFIDFVCHSDEKRTDHGSRDTLQLILHPSPRPSMDDARAFFCKTAALTAFYAALSLRHWSLNRYYLRPILRATCDINWSLAANGKCI